MKFFPSIEFLIPHQPPLRWIERLTACDATTAQAVARFTESSFAVANGRVTEAALVECLAQTVAAAERARQHGSEAGSGVLAAISNLRINDLPPVDAELRISIREIKRFGPMLRVFGEIWSSGIGAASGELTVHT